MVNRKNAFTLIEILAVIVILAIIALIAVPVVMNIITKSQKSAFKDSAYGIVKAGELYYTNQLLEPDGIREEIAFNLSEENEELEIKGEVPEGEMRINKEGDIALVVTNGKYCIRKDYKEKDITIDEIEEECSFYKEEMLNGTDPILKEGLIPITIDSEGIVRKASITRKWYSYEEKIWANAITVKEEVREKYESSSVGTIIKEEDILTYFVWIPRYKYKLWYADSTTATITGPHSIDIVFEDKDTTKSDGKCEGTYQKEANGCYLTHPAFTFGNDELNGMWVGKFETGYSGAATQTDAEIDEVNTNRLIIKPNVYSWRGIKISNAFYNSIAMNDKGNIFGLKEDSDTHVMKNTEWGSVAYLSHSGYGTCTDGDCTEVIPNNKYKTGCGKDSCSNQSTTKNISGIFDMSGGTQDFVMGVMSGYYGGSGFTEKTFPEDKYVDKYSTTNYRILGDATWEMGPFSYDGYTIGSWYKDCGFKITTGLPWYSRGLGLVSANAGIFASYMVNGNVYFDKTFRIVLA